MSKYDDIINLERPISKRSKMSIENRAAQFAPFSALTGYNEAIQETARITDTKIELSDNIKGIINDKLDYIYKNIKYIGDIKITYFVKDKSKSGGKYLDYIGRVKKIDKSKLYIYMMNDLKIAFEDILNISGDVFDYLDM